MRLVTIEKRVGSFSELSPELQKRVIEHFRYGETDIDYDLIIEDFCNAMEENGADVLPEDVHFSGFYSQGDGSCFSGKVVNFVKYISDVVNNYKHLFNSDKEFKTFLRWCKHVYEDCDYNVEINGNDRYFTDFTIDSFKNFIKNVDNISIEEYWITDDVRPGRETEKWLNLLLRKTNF